MELQGRIEELSRTGLGLAAISYDPLETLADFSQRRSITFPLLSDVGSATIKAYGILNSVAAEAFGPNRDDPALAAEIQKYVSVVRPNPVMAGIALPGTFIVDRQGRVTQRFFEESYIERSTVSSLMMRLAGDGTSVAGTRVSSQHVDIQTYPSDPAVAAGNRFSLAVEVEPRRNIHVYAPGAAGYKVITLTLEPQPFIRTLPVQYPSSEVYFFEPLNERVPVYQKPFTLVQDVILDGQPQAQAAYRGKASITLTGTLDYQACDDKICFTPVSVPLSWTLALKPLVTERPSRPQ